MGEQIRLDLPSQRLQVRLLVCGGRRYTKEDVVSVLLSLAMTKCLDDGLVLIHAGTRGAVAFANSWAMYQRAHRRDVTILRYDKGTVDSRVRLMFEEGKPNAIYVFPGQDAMEMQIVNTAKHLAIPVREIRWGEQVKRVAAPKGKS